MGASLSSLRARIGPSFLQVAVGGAFVGLLLCWHTSRRAVEGKASETVTVSVDNDGCITDFYDIGNKTGDGSYAQVRKGRNKISAQQVAVKTIRKDKTSRQASRVQSEITIMKSLIHPNIVELVESFQDERSYFLVLELCQGGELFDVIIDSGHFSEPQAKHCMRQILQAIEHCHGKKICLRGTKPEDIMLMAKVPIMEATLKIIDFGLAREFKDDEPMTTKAGTPYYVAPQVLAGEYDFKCDLWSCGVVMYVILCGYPPFFGESDAEVLAKVRLGNYSFNAADWKGISEDAKNLIRMLLKMNPADRLDASAALRSKWLNPVDP